MQILAKIVLTSLYIYYNLSQGKAGALTYLEYIKNNLKKINHSYLYN